MNPKEFLRRAFSRNPYSEEELQASKKRAIARAAEVEDAVYDVIPERVREHTVIGRTRKQEA